VRVHECVLVLHRTLLVPLKGIFVDTSDTNTLMRSVFGFILYTLHLTNNRTRQRSDNEPHRESADETSCGCTAVRLLPPVVLCVT
jgi:hypothetical protein